MGIWDLIMAGDEPVGVSALLYINSVASWIKDRGPTWREQRDGMIDKGLKSS